MKKSTLRQFKRQCRRAGHRTPYRPEAVVPEWEPRRRMPVITAACAFVGVVALTAVTILYGTPLGRNWLQPAGAGPASSAAPPSVYAPHETGASTGTSVTTTISDDVQGTRDTQIAQTGQITEQTNTTTTPTAAPRPAALGNPQTLEGYRQAVDLATGNADFRMTDSLSQKRILVPTDDSFTGLSQAERTELIGYMRGKGLDIREMTMEELIAQGFVTESTIVRSDDGSVIPYKTYHGAASLRFSIEKDNDGYILQLSLYYGPMGAEGIRPHYERAGGGWRLKPPENKFMA